MEGVYASELKSSGARVKQPRTGMDAVEIAISSVLMGIGKTYGKKYVVPPQKKILELLWRFHRIRISLRTVNRRLAWLELKGFITRIRRHWHSKTKGWQFRTTLYKFRGKLFNQLDSFGSWISGLFRFYRVPKKAIDKQYHSSRSALKASGDVEILLKSS